MPSSCIRAGSLAAEDILSQWNASTLDERIALVRERMDELALSFGAEEDRPAPCAVELDDELGGSTAVALADRLGASARALENPVGVAPRAGDVGARRGVDVERLRLEIEQLELELARLKRRLAELEGSGRPPS